MAELTIAQLTELLAANVDNADLLPIWDDTASETKKITISNFRTAVGVSNWSESFSSTTQATSRWIPNNAATNVNAAIVPKGNGAIVAAIPDGTATGGNARGTYAVDLQMVRSLATQVASGASSAILSGQGNRISSTRTNSFCVIGGGQSNLISQLYGATIAGGDTNTIGDNDGWQCTIGGGASNTITGRLAATIVGGNNNTASNNFVTMGGRANLGSGDTSTCIGGQGNTTSGAFSSILGGASNTASGSHSFVGGGQTNTASGLWSRVGGGKSNTAGGYYNVIGGGFTNSGTANAAVTTQSTTTTNASTSATLSVANASIRVGQYITGTGIASDTYVAAISGTSLTLSQNASGSGTNTLSFFTPHGVVVGGGNNQATGSYSFIGGGGDAGTAANRNVVSGDWSSAVGGRKNEVTQSFGGVLGGVNNRVLLYTAAFNAGSSYSIIVGGLDNVNGSAYSFIGGGRSNNLGDTTYQRLYSTIAGGFTNSSSADYIHIGGGANNSIVFGADYSNISGGSANTINSSRSYSTIGGGASNSVSSSGAYHTIGGGQSNTVSGGWATVGGGRQNTSSNSYTTVCGGYNNQATFTYDTICGGDSNSLTGQNNSQNRFIGGGAQNGINAEQTNGSLIVGGLSNKIYRGAGSFIVGGGWANGGVPNMVAATNSGILGGAKNTIGRISPDLFPTGSLIGIGEANKILSDASTIVNASNSQVDEGRHYGYIENGNYVNTTLYGQKARNSGSFANVLGDNQAHELIWRRAITGTAQTELFLDGASVAAILPATNTVWHGIIDITSICTVAGAGTTVVGDVAATSYKATIKRLNTNTSLVGTVQEIGSINANTSMAAVAFTINANDTNESLRILFTPPPTAAADTVIRVIATFRGTQIKY
jgi:hypothetical protein